MCERTLEFKKELQNLTDNLMENTTRNFRHFFSCPGMFSFQQFSSPLLIYHETLLHQTKYLFTKLF